MGDIDTLLLHELPVAVQGGLVLPLFVEDEVVRALHAAVELEVDATRLLPNAWAAASVALGEFITAALDGFHEDVHPNSHCAPPIGLRLG